MLALILSSALSSTWLLALSSNTWLLSETVSKCLESELGTEGKVLSRRDTREEGEREGKAVSESSGEFLGFFGEVASFSNCGCSMLTVESASCRTVLSSSMLSLSLLHLFRLTARASRGGGGGRKAGGGGRTSDDEPFWTSFAKEQREGSEMVLDTESEGEEGLVRRVQVVLVGGELLMFLAGSGNLGTSGPFSDCGS